MDERALQQRERRALCDTLDAVGADAPTMCEGWDAHDLAAHLVVRERDPWTAPVIICGVLNGVIHRMTLSEKSRALKEMSGATTNTTRQIALISKANKERAEVCAGLVNRVRDIRRISDRNASGVKKTRGNTTELLTRAETLKTLMSETRRRGNGGRTRTSSNGR